MAVSSVHLSPASNWIVGTRILDECLDWGCARRGCWLRRVVCAMVIAKSKKLKPQMNNTNTIKNMDYNWAAGPEPPNNQDVGVPKAVFVPHANSLPFEERRVTLEQSVKASIHKHLIILKILSLRSVTSNNSYYQILIINRSHLCVAKCMYSYHLLGAFSLYWRSLGNRLMPLSEVISFI